MIQVIGLRATGNAPTQKASGSPFSPASATYTARLRKERQEP